MKTITVKPILIDCDETYQKGIRLGTMKNKELIFVDFYDTIEDSDIGLFNTPLYDIIGIVNIRISNGIKVYDIDNQLIPIGRTPNKVIARQSQISPEYIEQFIEEYNKGEVKDIEIEIEELLTKVYDNIGGHPGGHWEGNGFKPLLSSGSITIVERDIAINSIECKKEHVPIPMIYSESEVKELCYLAMEYGQDKREFAYQLIDDWFNENKKK